MKDNLPELYERVKNIKTKKEVHMETM